MGTRCPVSTLHLDPVLGSTPAAREWIADQLQRCPIEVVECAALLISEVVTNAVLHARTKIHVTLRVSTNFIRVEVADRSPMLPWIPEPPSPDAETGRGLWLVNLLSSKWGVQKAQGGKVVWFELRPE